MTDQTRTPASPFKIDDRVEVIPAENKVLVEGKETKLEPRVMNVLLYLTGNKSRVISREEILKEVWGEVIVNDEAITQCIYQLRKVLGGDTQRKYIETIPKKGYRFLDKEVQPGSGPKTIRLKFSLNRKTLLRPGLALAALILLGAVMFGGGLVSTKGEEPEPVVSTKKIRAAMIDDKLVPLDSLDGEYQYKDSISIRVSVPSGSDYTDINMEELGKLLSGISQDSLSAMISEGDRAY